MSHKPPSDTFTRFTSTAPPGSPANSRLKASFSPNTSTSNQPGSPSRSPQSPGETAAERVARLRAAHRAQNAATKISPVDRLIARGRTAADVAHRVTTYSLLAVTGISSVIAVYGLVSLVSHNRRQKRAWIEREMDRLAEAQKAFLRGEANAEQLHLLEQERAGEEIARKHLEDKKQRKEEGVWHRLKGTFGGFVGQGDMGEEISNSTRQIHNTRDLASLSASSKVVDGEQHRTLLEKQQAQEWASSELRPVAVEAGPVAGVGLDAKGRPVPINKVERIPNDRRGFAGSMPDQKSTAESLKTTSGSGPGLLDALADNMTHVAQRTGQGWWIWISGRGNNTGRSSSVDN